MLQEHSHAAHDAPPLLDEQDFLKPREVQCPRCQILLTLPPGVCGCVVRCGQCHERFRLPTCFGATEDAVAKWLADQDAGEDDDAPSPPPREYRPTRPGAHVGFGGRTPPDEPAGDQAPQGISHHRDAPLPPPSGRTLVLPAVGGEVELVKISRRGALLEFAADRLNDRAFRCGMPRRCMQCGARSHLDAHVIVFAPSLKESSSIQAEHTAGPMVLRNDVAREMCCEDLLDRLPVVPNVPAPANQPMPYWLCDMCDTARAVSGQLEFRGEVGVCRLKIANLRRAEEFLAGIGARGTTAFRRVSEAAGHVAEKPWDSLPTVVQQRISQWFHPSEDEQFLAYVPDRARARTEDGMAGVLVSTQRIIYHGSMRHKETTADHPVQLGMAMDGNRGRLQIHTPDWDIKQLRIDKSGLASLRRALVKGKYRANWR